MALRSLPAKSKLSSSHTSASSVASLEYLSPDQLQTLTVAQLESLYLQTSDRIEARIVAGREHFTRYYESRIIDELSHRQPSDSTEQAKIDSCLRSHRAEMANMAAVLDLPTSSSASSSSVLPASDILAPDPTRCYTPDELIALLHLYTPCRDLTERERLVEYVDYSLNLLATSPNLRPTSPNLATPSPDYQPLANLIAELTELDRRHIVRSPRWLRTLLTDTIAAWLTSPTVPDTDMVLPLLTASLLNLTVTSPRHRPLTPSSLERRAQRIINRCYRTALTPLSTSPGCHSITSIHLSHLITSLYIAATCSSYVTRFSSRRLSLAWNSLAAYFLYIPNFTPTAPHSPKASITVSCNFHSPNSHFFISQLIYLLLIANELLPLLTINYSLYYDIFILFKKYLPSDNLRGIVFLRALDLINPSLAPAV